MVIFMLTILDESEARQDLANRRETKFALVSADIGKVRKVLETNSRRQIHNHEVSTVRSIYFDDVRLSACRANLDGIGQRRKVRLRWYDRPLPGNDSYLEIKWRDNKVTGKHRLRVRCEHSLGELSFAQMRELFLDSIPPRYLPYLLRYSEPIVTVEYKREHFTSRDNRLRATIDYDLTFYNQLGKQQASTRFGHRLTNFMVLEGKTPVGCENELRAMFAPLSLRACRCSKYVYGCRELGLIAGRD